MHEIDKRQFGAFVAQLRKEKGYTQKELAQRLFVSDKAVSKWETGSSIPDTALLLPLSELLGVTVTELLLCRRQMPDEPMEQDTVEQVVQAAVRYGEERPRRAWQEMGKWPAVYGGALVAGAAGMYALFRMDALLTQTALTLAVLGAVFGAYFCFYARLQLPERYDREWINLVYDGFFRMHMVGIAFNNRNWLPIVKVGRIWSCAAMGVTPLLQLAAAWLLPPAVVRGMVWQLGLAAVFLLCLFVPLYVVARRYQ